MLRQIDNVIKYAWKEDLDVSWQVAFRWNKNLDPIRFIESEEEPDLGYEPFTPAPNMVDGPPKIHVNWI